MLLDTATSIYTSRQSTFGPSPSRMGRIRISAQSAHRFRIYSSFSLRFKEIFVFSITVPHIKKERCLPHLSYHNHLILFYLRFAFFPSEPFLFPESASSRIERMIASLWFSIWR